MNSFGQLLKPKKLIRALMQLLLLLLLLLLFFFFFFFFFFAFSMVNLFQLSMYRDLCMIKKRFPFFTSPKMISFICKSVNKDN